MVEPMRSRSIVARNCLGVEAAEHGDRCAAEEQAGAGDRAGVVHRPDDQVPAVRDHRVLRQPGHVLVDVGAADPRGPRQLDALRRAGGAGGVDHRRTGCDIGAAVRSSPTNASACAREIEPVTAPDPPMTAGTSASRAARPSRARRCCRRRSARRPDCASGCRRSPQGSGGSSPPPRSTRPASRPRTAARSSRCSRRRSPPVGPVATAPLAAADQRAAARRRPGPRSSRRRSRAARSRPGRCAARVAAKVMSPCVPARCSCRRSRARP